MSASKGNIAAQHSLNGSGYSSVVRLLVRVDGREFTPAQIGAGRLYFNEPTVLPAGAAEIVIEVDGHSRTKHVLLPGSPTLSRIVEYTSP
jgi:hypothetical protein